MRLWHVDLLPVLPRKKKKLKCQYCNSTKIKKGYVGRAWAYWKCNDCGKIIKSFFIRSCDY